MTDWFYAAPHAVSGTAVVLAMVAAATLAHLAVYRAARGYQFSQNSAAVDSVLKVSGIVYAVVLGFVVAITWQTYYRSQQAIFDEVNAVADMYRYAPMLGEPLSSRVRAGLRRYVELELSDEIPAMEHGRAGVLTEAQGARLTGELVRAFGTSPGSGPARERELNLLGRVTDARRQGLYVNAGDVPPPLWVTLIAGSAIVLGMTFLAGAGDRRVHLALTAAATAMIGIMFVLILYLDAPFRGTDATQRYWQTLHAAMTRPDF